MIEFNIDWKFFISAKTKEKSIKIINKPFLELQISYEIGDCERYWKDKSLFIVNVKSNFKWEDIQTAIFNTLELSSFICRRWTIAPPQQFEEEKWEFRGWAINRNFNFQGIKEASFTMSTV